MGAVTRPVGLARPCHAAKHARTDGSRKRLAMHVRAVRQIVGQYSLSQQQSDGGWRRGGGVSGARVEDVEMVGCIPVYKQGKPHRRGCWSLGQFINAGCREKK